MEKNAYRSKKGKTRGLRALRARLARWRLRSGGGGAALAVVVGGGKLVRGRRWQELEEEARGEERVKTEPPSPRAYL